jgi:protein ImuA
MLPNKHTALVKALQAEVCRMERAERAAYPASTLSVSNLLCAGFPDKRFPLGAVHEFISTAPDSAAATDAFICTLMHTFLEAKGYCLWVNKQQDIYAPALAQFGLQPEQIIFVSVGSDKEALWVLEEALKCEGLYAVAGSIRELSFNESRRLQLAVEKSGVTGFIHRMQPRAENIVACASRWKVRPLPSMTEAGFPGPGFPRWEVQLLKVRNGRPMRWELEWTPSGLRAPISTAAAPQQSGKRQAG